MRNPAVKSPLDRATLLGWIGMLAVGIAAWGFSGTPVVGALAVVAVLLAAISPTGALYATCAAIPLIFHTVDIGSLQVGLLELGTLATVAGFGIRSAFDFVERQHMLFKESFGRPASWILPLLLLLVGTLSLVWLPFDLHRSEALRTWRWVILEPLLLFVLARYSINRNGVEPLTAAIVLPAAIVSLFAIWQLALASSNFSADDVSRSTGTYLHPNNLALYLERAFMLASVPGLFLRSRARWPLLGLSFLLLLGVAATFSRGALLGLAFGGAVVLLANPIRHGWRIFATVGAGSVAGFSLVAGARLSGASSSGLGDTRRALWSGAGQMLRDFPITGIGLDQFLWLNQTRYIEPRIWEERYTSHPHNLVLDSWLSLGLAGMVLLAVIVTLGAVTIWRTRIASHRAFAMATRSVGLPRGRVGARAGRQRIFPR